MTRRTVRLAEMFRKEISCLLQREIKDPRIGFATISRVEVSEDLSEARVFVSVFGEEKEQRDSLIGLTNSAGHLRTMLSRTIKIRRMPHLSFFLDKGLDNSWRIQELLREVQDDLRRPDASGS